MFTLRGICAKCGAVLHIGERWRRAFSALKIESCAAAARHFLGEEFSTPGVRVVQRDLEFERSTESLFFKQYYYAPASWRFLGRASKAVREARNAVELRRMGLAVPDVICWGEERDAVGRLRRGIIATVAVPQAAPLPGFLQHTGPSGDPAAQAARAAVLRELAESVRRMHQAGFYHHDLVGRNVLYSEAVTPRLWWIDCPRGAYDRWSPWRGRKRLRDLAGLDKTLVQFCSRGERLRWLLGYLGKSRLTPEDKVLVQKIAAYRLAH